MGSMIGGLQQWGSIDLPSSYRDRHKEYYEANKSQILIRQKEYNEKKRKKISAYQKEYYKKNRDKLLKYSKKYQKSKLPKG